MTPERPERTDFRRMAGPSIVMGLILLTLAVYGQVTGFDFVNFDDPYYVTENEIVRKGLTAEGFLWAATTRHISNWHPLTWLSHMLDCQLFGLHPGGHHFVNVMLHIANSILLFLVFREMTGDLPRSALMAALFALHPQHVESVAWVSERKDVLSALFWLLAIRSYAAYCRTLEWRRYGEVVLFFLLGLMSKPMVITLPCVLLLMDVWPLGRLGHRPMSRLAAEKIPLLILSACSAWVTVVAQESGGAVGTLREYPLSARISNAVVSYGLYLVKMIYPTGLSPYYPYPERIPGWQVAVAAASLIFITGAAVAARRRRPYLLVGWLWYLGALFPVIGVIQVGSQAMADRYTYIPLIGVFIMAVWGFPVAIPAGRRAMGILVGILLLVLAGTAFIQTGHWRDSETMFSYALALDEQNAMAHINLGAHYANQKRYEEAVLHFERAMEIEPGFRPTRESLNRARFLLGHGLAAEGNYDRARRYLATANGVDPDGADGFHLLGLALLDHGRMEEALHPLRQAVRLDPAHADAINDLGEVLARRGDCVSAVGLFARALEIAPERADIRNNLERCRELAQPRQ